MSKELKTGIAALAIICLGYWGFNFLKGQNLLEAASRVFYIEYDNIQGLNKSSIVSINGLQVGKVSDIYFNSDPDKKGKLIVKISLDNNFEFSKKYFVNGGSGTLPLPLPCWGVLRTPRTPLIHFVGDGRLNGGRTAIRKFFDDFCWEPPGTQGGPRGTPGGPRENYQN